MSDTPPKVYDPSPSAKIFHESKARVKVLWGPLGCIAPETQIITDQGLRRIDSLDEPTKVLSWKTNGKDERHGGIDEFVFVEATPSFVKGKARLYRVRSKYGEWRAAGHHRVLYTDEGVFVPVSSLAAGKQIPRYCWDDYENGLAEPPDGRSVSPSQETEILAARMTWPILSVEQEAEESEYWDIHVPGTHNYVTVDGTIHHNSGKSCAGLWEFFLQALEATHNIEGLVVRSSYRELRDTTRKLWREWFGSISEWREKDEEFLVRLPHPTERGRILEHRLKLRAIQKPEDAQKVQSFEGSFVLMDEVAPAFSTAGVMGQGLPEEVFNITLARMREGGKSGNRRTVVLTSNPPSASHWLYHKFISIPDEELAARQGGAICVFQPPGTNFANLPDHYYDELRENFDEDMAKRFLDGEIIHQFPGEPVFPETRDGWHVLNGKLEPTPGTSLILGFDWGLCPSTLITQVTPSGHWMWLEELCSMNVSVEKHMERLRDLMQERYRGYAYRSWGDPAGTHRSQTDEKTCFQIASRMGFPVRAGRQDWISRRDAVKNQLTRLVGDKPRLLISREGCPVAAEGMLGAYRYAKYADGRIGNRPIKNMFSHVIDAAEYVATREFQIRPDRVVPEDPLADAAREHRIVPIWNPLDEDMKPRTTTGTSWMSR